MWEFLQDVRFGARMMAKAPAVMAIAALSLALGISANTTTFSVANGFFFEPFPYADQDRLVFVFENHRKETDDQPVAPANFLDWRERATSFEALVAYDIRPANLTGGEAPERTRLVETSPETFSVLGREPLFGRSFESGEGVQGRDRIVVLSYSFWQRYFAAEPDIVGRRVSLDGEPHTIVGVMPEDFDFLPANVDLYRPTDWRDRATDRDNRSLLVVGRLKPDKRLAEAEAELSAIARQLEETYPEANEGYGVRATALRDVFPGPTDSMLMYILLTVSGFVLLIACANIANLLLARAEARQREVAVRTALGAGRGRILRQLLTESVLLGLSGGALGTLLSIESVRWVSAAMPAELPRAFLPELDGTVLVFTLGISVLAGVVFGVAPALHAFGDDVREALGEASRGGTSSRKRNRLRSAFVVAELAAALALLVGAGVLLHLFEETLMRNPGFDVNGILTAQLTVSEDRYREDQDVARFYREVLRRLEETSGIERVAAMNELPRSRASSETSFTIDRRAEPRPNEEPVTGWQAVNDSYFRALGVPILRGRGITPSDGPEAERVAVVNESFVDRFFPEEEPLDQRVTIHEESRRVVGIVRNIFQDRIPEEGGKIGAVVYLPMEQHPVRTMSLAMRVRGEPSAYAASVRDAIWAVDPDQPVTAIQSLEEHIATQLAGPRVISIVLGAFGTVALLLSAIGIYGVMAHSVAQRTREIGIRMALGAAGADVTRLVTRQGMRLASIGLLLGAPLAYAMIRAVGSLFLSGNGSVPSIVGSTVLVLTLVALLATYLPARRASRLHPVRALQVE